MYTDFCIFSIFWGAQQTSEVFGFGCILAGEKEMP